MCGIVGIVNKKGLADSSILQAMSDRLYHRGPDGSGAHLYQSAAIGHRRLSIIDLEGGKQPLSNETKTIWISFNGELYNYLELKKVLIAKGHHFRTSSDTEVIVHAYEEWGTECLHQFRGMFAFAILDQEKKELFIARDHFGIKPLVYADIPDCFAFASEIQALTVTPGFDRSMDLSSLDLYLQFSYIPSPYSIYQSVRKLPPAHFMRVSLEGNILELKKYWQFEFKQGIAKTEEDWLEGLEAVIKESVKSHLVSDVPFGAFLSGGIDSSLVVGYMAEQMQMPVKTFSIGFGDQQFSELDYSRQVSAKWKTEHYEEIVEPDALAILPKLVEHYGEPFGDTSAIPTWYVSRLARQHVKMVLTGDGGDEFFGGYYTYTEKWSRHTKVVPEHLKGIKRLVYPLMHQLNPHKYAYRGKQLNDWLRYISYFDDTSRKRIFRNDVLQATESLHRSRLEEMFEQSLNGHFQKAQRLDIHTYLPDDILNKVDIAGMMHGLEARTPLVDIRVAEYAAQLPECINIVKEDGKWQGKYLLKKLLRKNYPPEFVDRKKMGFEVPLKKWFAQSKNGEGEMKSRLLDRQDLFHSIFEKDELERLAKSDDSRKQWLLVFLQEWLSQFNF